MIIERINGVIEEVKQINISEDYHSFFKIKKDVEISKNILFFFMERLESIKYALINNKQNSNIKYTGEIARMVTEFNPKILDPKLGGKIIEIEKEYFKKFGLKKEVSAP